MVGNRKRSTTRTGRSSACFSRACTSMTAIELPPISKKLSLRVMPDTPRTSHQIPEIRRSRSLLGVLSQAPPGYLAGPGGGSALRSTFPAAVSGNQARLRNRASIAYRVGVQRGRPRPLDEPDGCALYVRV
jgi:hypothetical protein